MKKTILQLANENFRLGNFYEAIDLYEKAICEIPQLRFLIENNLQIAKNKLVRKSYVEEIQSTLERSNTSKKVEPKNDPIIQELSFISEKLDLGIIILSLNGAELLNRLFASLSEYMPESNFKIFITDHGSTDNTVEVIKNWSNVLPIETYFAKENYTFSFSNNRWAEKLIDCKKLLFLNNDIVFLENVIDRMANVLNDVTVGIVGVEQLEMPNKDVEELQWHHRGIGFRWDEEYKFWRPFNIQDKKNKDDDFVREIPAVTGSVMMIRRNDFLGVGGFDERYVYGYEDIDLCLAIKKQLNKSCVCLSTDKVIHADGVTRKKTPSKEIKQQRLNNIDVLRTKYSSYINRLHRSNIASDNPISNRPPTIAFAVTEVGQDASAGDLFTAMELGQAMFKEFGWDIVYLPKGEKWYDLSNIDIIIAMVDAYEPGKIHRAHPGLVKIAWARNWFDRWCAKDWSDEYDIYLASSQLSAEYITQQTGQPAHVLRIATNPEIFNPAGRKDKPDFDYVFTGSYWNADREIVSSIKEIPVKARGAIYGKNWEKLPEIAHMSKGFVRYEDLPKIYRNALIVVDDANHVTKPWGSANSRVFDALAIGCIVVTNSEKASNDAFGGLLPFYNESSELGKLISELINDDSKRCELQKKLRKFVLDNHTYTHRAYEFKNILSSHLVNAVRYSIKIPVPKWELAQEWGDYHFAKSLAKQLRKEGQIVRLDFLPEWDRGDFEGDDVSLVLRGLSEYKPKKNQINLMWLISHPDKVFDKELNNYDCVFVASKFYKNILSRRLSVSVLELLQCTDIELFNRNLQIPSDIKKSKLLFVGNSRKKFRPIISDAIKAGLNVDVYGTCWNDFIPQEMILGNNIPNNVLGHYYSNANIVLNDHWEDMSRLGFMSNRLFDAVACGATVISDKCEGILEVFGKSVNIYDGSDNLKNIVDNCNKNSGDNFDNLSSRIKTQNENNFSVRAKFILNIAKKIMGQQSS